MVNTSVVACIELAPRQPVCPIDGHNRCVLKPLLGVPVDNPVAEVQVRSRLAVGALQGLRLHDPEQLADDVDPWPMELRGCGSPAALSFLL